MKEATRQQPLSGKNFIITCLGHSKKKLATMEEMLRAVFSVRAVLRLYNKEQRVLRLVVEFVEVVC
jgi:hypothetical protein